MEIIVFLVIFLIISTALRKDAPTKADLAKALKACPPHNWQYHDVDGVTRLKCDTCKMLPGEETYQPRGLGK